MVVESADKTKKVRFGLNNPSPHNNPHTHVEELKRVKNRTVPTRKSGPIYPRDVPRE